MHILVEFSLCAALYIFLVLRILAVKLLPQLPSITTRWSTWHYFRLLKFKRGRQMRIERCRQDHLRMI